MCPVFEATESVHNQDATKEAGKLNLFCLRLQFNPSTDLAHHDCRREA